MEEKDTRAQRLAVLLLVCLLHGLLIASLMRERKLVLFSKQDSSERLLVYFLPRESSPDRNAPAASSSTVVVSNAVLQRKRPPSNAPNAPITLPIETAAPTSQIDWQHELELAVHDRVADEEREKTYRDLSESMSPSQLDWLQQHRMERASPGLTWKKPRVEVTKDGMPIVHINDHCVLVPLLFVPMVFCSIGHIEPNGDLFKGMRDPQPP